MTCLKVSVALLVTICVGGLLGCKKDEAAASGVAAPSSNAPMPAAVPPAPKFITANAQNEPAKNVAGEVDPFLTQQLQIFVQQRGRMPHSFAELAAARLDSIPSAPGRQEVGD